MSSKQHKKKLPFTCPICGKRTDRPVDDLREGASITCPFCNLRLILHGHMWQEVKEQIAKIT